MGIDRREITMDYEIKKRKQYYEVYINGELYCTADDIHEAEREIENFLTTQN